MTTLAWDPPVNADGTPFTGINGYKLHVGSASRNYSQTIDVGNTTTYALNNLSEGSTYYFTVTDYDGAGNESGYSNEISKSFPFTYSLTATASAGGTIAPVGSVTTSTATSGTSTITSMTVSQGGSQSFSIIPNAGYSIANVTVDGVSVGAVNTYTFTNVTADHAITATFASFTASSTFTVTATSGTGGSITPSGITTVNSGASQVYTIAPTAGYRIADVIVDGISVGAVSSYTFSNVVANRTISATFSASTSTSTTFTSSSVWQNQSIPSQNGVFTTSFDLIPNDNNINALTVLSAMPAQDVTNGATMVRFNPTGTIDARNGSIYAADAAIPYTAGNTYHVRMLVNVTNHTYDVYVAPQGGAEICLATGYAFRTEQASASPLNNLGFVAFTGSHQVLNFAIAPLVSYSISASAGTGGSITPSGNTSMNSGASQTYTIAPSAGYTIADVKVDGISVGAVASYTFSNITANHTITANFAATPVTYTLSASASAGGSITPSGTTTVNSGATQTYTFTPAVGYSIASVTVDGVSVGSVANYTFNSITANHTIVANFVVTAGHWNDIGTAKIAGLDGSAQYMIWSPIKADATGTVNKLRISIRQFGSPTQLRLALYNKSGKKLTEGSVVAAAAGYVEISVNPVSVSQGTTYYIAAQAASNLLYKFDCGAVSGGFEAANAFSNGLPSSLPGTTKRWGNYLLTASMYIR
ncbi:fibronectin type III domain-containing protein [Geobacter luticola]|uniref:Fibronectin type III domain-containing protein n=2 Tax=Geomobilimonas luticola TaxID=1114878 RepID=A0ABS5SC53_9BACT|nr:fibronectin type III domain-containing protein [Geomobilimonas luticola]MBT0652939.1 fibronectin type III domain-containing protein [Geomobilimonas luticola]